MKQILCLQFSQGLKTLLYDTVVVYLPANIRDINVAIVYSYGYDINIQCLDENMSLGMGTSLLITNGGSYIATSDSLLGIGIIADL